MPQAPRFITALCPQCMQPFRLRPSDLKKRLKVTDSPCCSLNCAASRRGYPGHLQEANAIRLQATAGKLIRCRVCDRLLPRDDFETRISGKTKRPTTRCKKCNAKRSLRYYRKHRKQISARRRTLEFRKWFNKYASDWAKRKRKTDRNFAFKKGLRCYLFKHVKEYKSGHTSELIGCSVAQLKNYLESLFQPGMTWSNYGRNGWHIDHIRPCASFDLTDEKQQKQCFHYTNLQPLWAIDNLKKGSKRR